AGLLDDGILLQMSWAKLWRVMAPKAIGGWLLSELSRDLKLECFVVFSSILSLIGSAGQANYSAANAFLDGLVGQRRAEGLPALALNFGPWAQSGLATESGEKGRQIWRARGTEYIPASLGVEALDAAVGGALAQAQEGGAGRAARHPDRLCARSRHEDARIGEPHRSGASVARLRSRFADVRHSAQPAGSRARSEIVGREAHSGAERPSARRRSLGRVGSCSTGGRARREA